MEFDIIYIFNNNRNNNIQNQNEWNEMKLERKKCVIMKFK